MNERPILFSGSMVRAILSGQKTQTRRIVKPQPSAGVRDSVFVRSGLEDGHGRELRCPYGQPRDRLWVRETWRHSANSLEEARAITEDITSGTAVDWRATYVESRINELGFSREDAEMADKFEVWRPSIHMPRWASRITLEITGVHVERLGDISDTDVDSEGVEGHYVEDGWYWRNYLLSDEEAAISPMLASATESFRSLWEKINGAGSWDVNPWVWVVKFRRVQS